MKTRDADIGLKGKNLKDEDAISASVKNILSTKKGERVFDRNFGSNLENYLFEPYTFSTTRFMLADIKSSLRQEPRVELLSTSTVELDPETRSYNIVLNLRIRKTNEIVQFKQVLKAK